MSYTLNRKIHIKRDVEEDLRSQQQIDKWILYILMVVIIIVPLLIGGHISEVVSPLIEDSDQLISGQKIDIFTFYKLIALVTLTVIAFGLFMYKLFFLDYRLPRRPILWFFAIFIVAIVFATIFSSTKTIALYGQYNRSDGGLSYICYVLLMFVAMHIKYPRKVVEFVLFGFYPLVIINFIITTMNFTGHDVLNFDPVNKALTFFASEIVFDESSNLIGTLNHWNYMSGMFALLTVMYLSWIVVDKNNLRRFINLIIALLAVTTMLIGMSASGFVTFVVMTPFILWIAIKSVRKKTTLIYISVFYVLTAGIIHVLSQQNPEAWDESVGFFLPGNPYDIMQYEETSIKEYNSFDLTKIFGAAANATDSTFKLPELPESNWGPGTGRIYIWQKTLQLVGEKPLFGFGLDTLMYNFPHYDIEAQANLNEVTIVDKPHSFYVGIIYGTGFIGIIGLLGIIINVSWASLKHIIRFDELSSPLVILCITWLAFLVQALFNDSLPGTTTPLFIIGGIIMALVNKDIVIKNDDSRID